MKASVSSYLRLCRFDKPIGIYLLLWPTLTALWIAGNGRPSALLVVVFSAGVALTRAMGCVLNDILDRNFDKFVQRTQDRPVTSGEVSLLAAVGVALLLGLAAACLLLLLNTYTVLLALVALVLMLIYPLMKRYISCPQLVLGVAFSWGILMAFSAERNALGWSAGLLFLINLIWTVMYDTYYAMVDAGDDKQLGLNSTALWFGDKAHLAQAIMQISVLVLLLILGKLISANSWFYIACMGVLGLFMHQQWLSRSAQRDDYFQAFLNNHWALLLILVGVFLSYLP